VGDTQNGVRRLIHAHLYKVTTHKPTRIDWEHIEFHWIAPQQLKVFETVPGLVEALSNVLPV